MGSSQTYFSIREFAEMFGYSEKYVRRLVQQGKIKAVRLHFEDGKIGDWRISLDFVRLHSNEPAPPSIGDGDRNVSTTCLQYSKPSKNKRSLIDLIKEM
jgi:excisionase family DNA binding protein